MNDVLAVIVLALLWAFLLGEAGSLNLIIGALLAITALRLVRPQSESDGGIAQRSLAFVRFVLSFAKELFMANILIAMLALHPEPKFHPHIIAVPIEKLESDAAIAILSAVITLLPGTVAMGVSADKRLLYAHAIGSADPQEAKDSVTRMEVLIAGFTR